MSPKPYIELADFPELTPFTSAAIRAYMQRGDLVEGVHYFRGPARGRRPGRPIFKWSAIETWIEQRRGLGSPANVAVAGAVDVVPLRRRA